MSSFAILCLYLVFKIGPLVRQIQASLVHTQTTLEHVSKQVEPAMQYVKELQKEALPILQNVKATTRTSISISHKVDDQLDKTGKVVAEVAELTTRVAAIERDFEDQIVEPIRQIGSVVSSTSKAVKAFAGVMSGSNSINGTGGSNLPPKL